MALHVVEEPVAQLVGSAPGMPRLDPLVAAVGHADAPQSVVLNVVDQFHGKDHAGAERGVPTFIATLITEDETFWGRLSAIGFPMTPFLKTTKSGGNPVILG